ncbi:helix-turn-helix domain-containing protein [Saccharopolyspora indica]|uniref:helix-turn-helix domain-containing protein n=1 Tax=Saccharopolyspora indica TaxID=1229659 RepID=UPI0022EB33AF|nr:helix-turn-helix domain-containing protein [Saccharopolyspora indica]MDA3644155.1 helix-turn-helix domain-containing protein [Saccharopolyspora indica]
MPDQGRRYYRVKEVADLFDVSVNTIYRAIDSKQLTALKIGEGKGAYRVPDYAVAAFEKACTQAAHEDHAISSAPMAEVEGIELGEAA